MHDLALVFHMYGPTPLSSAYLVSSFVRSFVRTYLAIVWYVRRVYLLHDVIDYGISTLFCFERR